MNYYIESSNGLKVPGIGNDRKATCGALTTLFKPSFLYYVTIHITSSPDGK